MGSSNSGLLQEIGNETTYVNVSDASLPMLNSQDVPKLELAKEALDTLGSRLRQSLVFPVLRDQTVQEADSEGEEEEGWALEDTLDTLSTVHRNVQRIIEYLQGQDISHASDCNTMEQDHKRRLQRVKRRELKRLNYPTSPSAGPKSPIGRSHRRKGSSIKSLSRALDLTTVASFGQRMENQMDLS